MTKPLELIRAEPECSIFAKPATLKICNAWDPKKPWEQKQKFARQNLELRAELVVLLKEKIANRAVLKGEFAPHQDDVRAKLLAAQVKAREKAEKIYPPTDSPNMYEERLKMVEQLTKNEQRAVQWEPACLSRNQFQNDADALKAAKAALAAEFRA
jgi:hypothetical protein